MLPGNPVAEPSNPFNAVIDNRADSLNVRFVGNWPFGACWGVELDSTREIGFLGSGGGVYIIDVSNPEDPVDPACLADLSRHSLGYGGS